jgi:hypothetical protein
MSKSNNTNQKNLFSFFSKKAPMLPAAALSSSAASSRSDNKKKNGINDDDDIPAATSSTSSATKHCRILEESSKEDKFSELEGDELDQTFNQAFPHYVFEDFNKEKESINGESINGESINEESIDEQVRIKENTDLCKFLTSMNPLSTKTLSVYDGFCELPADLQADLGNWFNLLSYKTMKS